MWLKLYGVESRIYINDEEPCTLGVDCDENGFSIEDDEDDYGGKLLLIFLGLRILRKLYWTSTKNSAKNSISKILDF